MPPPQSARNTFLPPYSNVNCWMKCGGMISPLASLTKPESIGCWISACTSVVSPLDVARTRMVDAIVLSSCPLAAATADGDLDFLVGAVELAARFHDHDDVAGLRHLDAVGNVWKRARRNSVGRHQHDRIFADQERDRGHVRQRRRDRNRNHGAVLGDFAYVQLDLVRCLRRLAVERLDRVGFALRLESLFRIFVVGRGERARRAKRKIAETEQRDCACTLQYQPPRGRKSDVSHIHYLQKRARARHSVCRKSTTALISFSVRIRLRPNGGITVSGLRRVSSLRMATRSSRLGYLLLMSTSSGPIVPGRSPPLMTWQVRQLPLLRSKASLRPSSTADCACAVPMEAN